MICFFCCCVFYIFGYDLILLCCYCEFYKCEGVEQVCIFGYVLDFGVCCDCMGFGWGVMVQFGGMMVESEIEVLVWVDIVVGLMGQLIVVIYGQLVCIVWVYIGMGVLFCLMWLWCGLVIVVFYLVVVLLGQLFLVLLVGVGFGWGFGCLMGFGVWIVFLVMVVVIWVGFLMWWCIDGWIFVYYLMYDYVFIVCDMGVYFLVLCEWLVQFSDRIVKVLGEDWDEVLVVGYSFGVYLGVLVLVDLICVGCVLQGVWLFYLLLGYVVLMVLYLLCVNQLCVDLCFLLMWDELVWVDVSVLGDVCCFGLCDLVVVLGVVLVDQCYLLVFFGVFK